MDKRLKLSKEDEYKALREGFMVRVELMFKNVETMEARLTKKGKVPMKDKHYRRLATALARSVEFAREKGWMRAKA